MTKRVVQIIERLRRREKRYVFKTTRKRHHSLITIKICAGAFYKSANDIKG